jgi:hypothetical protein
LAWPSHLLHFLERRVVREHQSRERVPQGLGSPGSVVASAVSSERQFTNSAAAAKAIRAVAMPHATPPSARK